MVNGLLTYDGKVCVPRRAVRDVLREAHDARLGGHFGFTKTMSKLDGYHWKHKYRDVRRYCEGCTVCQQQKDRRSRKLGVPTPLDVPKRRWGSVATDFIVAQPKTAKGYDAITTWVDRLSRRVHFIPCRTTDNAMDTAEGFFQHVFKLHGIPDSIVSDRDAKFTSKFWKHLMALCGVTLQMSSTHHPQTDGTSEIMNRLIENYIRCYCGYRQNDWDDMLPAAEFAYNSAVSDELQASPFEVDLGWVPKSPLAQLGSVLETPIASVNELKGRLAAALNDARFAHQVSKAKNASYASQRMKEPSYRVGDQVWLNRSIFKDAISKVQTSDKLGSRRFGPFTITEKLGKNAVRLDLPQNIRLHPVVHVSHTVPYLSQPPDISRPVPIRPNPVSDVDGRDLYAVDRIISYRKRGRG